MWWEPLRDFVVFWPWRTPKTAALQPVGARKPAFKGGILTYSAPRRSLPAKADGSVGWMMRGELMKSQHLLTQTKALDLAPSLWRRRRVRHLALDASWIFGAIYHHIPSTDGEYVQRDTCNPIQPHSEFTSGFGVLFRIWGTLPRRRVNDAGQHTLWEFAHRLFPL